MAYQNLLCFDNAGNAQTISDDFPQHIAPETPLQHVCDFLFVVFWGKTCVSHICCLHFCWSNNSKKEQQREHKCLILRNIFSIKYQMQVIPLSRNPRDKKKKKKEETMFFSLFSLLFVSFHFCSFFSFIFISVHVFHFFSFHAFSFSWKHITNPGHLHVDPLSFADWFGVCNFWGTPQIDPNSYGWWIISPIISP